MLPTFLLEERVVCSDGAGPPMEVGTAAGKLVVLTVGITRIVEQESLEVTVWGSNDGEHWGAYPLARYPRKLYCGIYSMLLNLSGNPGIEYLRVQWNARRIARTESPPLFSFYVYMEESGSRIAVGVAA